MSLMNELETGRTRVFHFVQRAEVAELFGFETRNKYAILAEADREVGFAAEQQKGILGFLLRQWLGHWRSFEIHVFDSDRQPVFVASHPFRFFFQRVEVRLADGRSVGTVRQRFSLLNKRFDVLRADGSELFQVSSPFWRFWTFPFLRHGRQVAIVQKRWSGALTELFLDKDRFRVEIEDPSLAREERLLILASALFIDLQYFEAKAD